MMKILKVKRLKVPVDGICEVADILAENGITNSLVGSNDDASKVFIEVSYAKDENQFIHEINDVIEEYEDDEEDEDEDE
jgi:hypothetical protein